MFTLMFTILSIIGSTLICYMGIKTQHIDISLFASLYIALGFFCLIEQWATRKTLKD